MSEMPMFDELDELQCDCDDYGTWTHRVHVDGAKAEVSTYACRACVVAKAACLERHAAGTPIVTDMRVRAS